MIYRLLMRPMLNSKRFIFSVLLGLGLGGWEGESEPI